MITAIYLAGWDFEETAAEELPDWRVVFAYPAKFSPKARVTVDVVTALLTDESRARVLQLDYEEIATRLQTSNSTIAHELSAYMEERQQAMAGGARRGQTHPM